MEKQKFIEIDVKFKSSDFNLETNQTESKIVSKKVKCLLLDENTQGSLPFEIFDMFSFTEKQGAKKSRWKANPSILQDLAIKYLNEFVEFDEEFTISNKTELENNAMAMVAFGNSLFALVFTPFFAGTTHYFT